MLLVKMMLNPTRGRELLAAGIRLVARDEARQQAIDLMHRAEAEVVGGSVDAREDRIGTVRSDSGTPIFPFGKPGAPEVILAEFVNDLTDAGYVNVDVHLMNRPGDDMYFLVFVFGVSGEKFQVPEKARPIVGRFLRRAWKHTHGYRNPDGSCTINSSHALDNTTDPTYLRLHDDKKQVVLRDEAY